MEENNYYLLFVDRDYNNNNFACEASILSDDNWNFDTTRLYSGSWGYTDEYGFKSAKLYQIDITSDEYTYLEIDIPDTEIEINTYNPNPDNPDQSSQYVLINLANLNIGTLDSLVYVINEQTSPSGNMLSCNSIQILDGNVTYKSLNFNDGIWQQYNKYVPIPKEESNSSGDASYYNPTSRRGINYVLECMGSKSKKIGDVSFKIELNRCDFYNNSGKFDLNLNVLPLNGFKLQSMDIIIKLFDKDDNTIYECPRNGVGITNTQYYAGECYWTSNDTGFTYDMKPDIDIFMNAVDYDVEISNVVSKFEDVQIQSDSFGGGSQTVNDMGVIPLTLNLKNGAHQVYVEPDNPDSGYEVPILIEPNSYVSTEEIFSDKDNYTINTVLRVINSVANSYLINLGGFYNGYGVMYPHSNNTTYGAHMFGSGEGSYIDASLLQGQQSIIDGVESDTYISPCNLTVVKTKDPETNNHILKVYINGELIMTKGPVLENEDHTNWNSYYIKENEPIKWGYGPKYYNNESEYGTQQLSMEIYDIKYFDHVLTDEEIKTVYNDCCGREWMIEK